MGVFPPLRLNHVFKDSLVRVGEIEIPTYDSRSVTMSGSDEKRGPKEGLTNTLNFFILLGPSGQIEIVTEDGCAFNARCECMPSAR